MASPLMKHECLRTWKSLFPSLASVGSFLPSGGCKTTSASDHPIPRLSSKLSSDSPGAGYSHCVRRSDGRRKKSRVPYGMVAAAAEGYFLGDRGLPKGYKLNEHTDRLGVGIGRPGWGPKTGGRTLSCTVSSGSHWRLPSWCLFGRRTFVSCA